MIANYFQLNMLVGILCTGTDHQDLKAEKESRQIVVVQVTTFTRSF